MTSSTRQFSTRQASTRRPSLVYGLLFCWLAYFSVPTINHIGVINGVHVMLCITKGVMIHDANASSKDGEHHHQLHSAHHQTSDHQAHSAHHLTSDHQAHSAHHHTSDHQAHSAHHHTSDHQLHSAAHHTSDHQPHVEHFATADSAMVSSVSAHGVAHEVSSTDPKVDGIGDHKVNTHEADHCPCVQFFFDGNLLIATELDVIKVRSPALLGHHTPALLTAFYKAQARGPPSFLLFDQSKIIFT
ncbi:hypothetical protein [Marinomonas sp. THO17]|uniref:hypothetical protein n=1 Tax=Marinomonas sp. THO17 TaxID=3149048 RepID=UPI00336BE271